MVGNRNHILPAVSARIYMKLMSQAKLCQFLVEGFVRFCEAIPVLVADIEIDLDARLLNRGEVLLYQKHGIRRAEIFFVRWIAKNLSDQLRQEHRPAIATCRLRQFGYKRGAMGSYR